jgi:hypothetical protein
MRLSDLCLSPDLKSFDFDVVFVVGGNRVGKTLLSVLLATFRGAEHVDESWLPTMLPQLQERGVIKRDAAVQMLRSYIEDLFYEVILARKINLRPNDRSSTWQHKTPASLMYRMNLLRTRRQAEAFSKNRKALLLLSLPCTASSSDFLQSAIPKSRVLHVVRHAYGVAYEIAAKRWFSNDTLRVPLYTCLRFRYKSSHFKGVFFIPWWVQEDDAEYFLRLSDFERGLYFWRRMLPCDGSGTLTLKNPCQDAYRLVRYEDVASHPRSFILDMCRWLSRKPTRLTKNLLAEIKKPEPVDYPKEFSKISDVERKKTNSFLVQLGYPSVQ